MLMSPARDRVLARARASSVGRRQRCAVQRRDLVVELAPGPRRAPRAARSARRSRAPAGPSPSHSRANTASAFAAITTSRPSAVGYAFDGATPGRTPPLRVAGHAAELEVGDGRLHEREHRLVDRDVDLLAPSRCACRSCTAASVPITANSAASESPSEMPVRAGRPVGIAGGVADAAHRLADRAEAGLVRPRAGLAEPGDVHEHERRVRRGERRRSRCPSARACPGLKFSSTTSTCAGEVARRRRARARSRRSIATDRLLRAIAGHQRLRPSIEHAPPPHRVAGPGRLDLDHLGAEIAEQLTGERAGDERAELEDAQARRGPGERSDIGT